MAEGMVLNLCKTCTKVKAVLVPVHITNLMPFPVNIKLQTPYLKEISNTLAPVVQKVDSAIHRINLYPLDSAIGSRNIYSLDSYLSGGQRYPAFEQLGPDQNM